MVIEDSDQAFRQMLEANGYYDIRKLPDGTWAALYRLIFTTAICTGLDDLGWAYRWCFDDPDMAAAGLAKLEAMDDEPAGYVARRGR